MRIISLGGEIRFRPMGRNPLPPEVAESIDWVIASPCTEILALLDVRLLRLRRLAPMSGSKELA